MSTNRKRPKSEDVEEAMIEAVQLAQSKGIRIAAVGGLAMQLYGSDRLTYDVDVAVDRSFALQAPVEELSFGGKRSFANNGVEVDAILRSDEFRSLYEEALQEVVLVDGVPTVTPEHLAAMKMVAGRAKDDLDLTFLIQEEILDLKKAAAIIRRHLGPYAVKEFKNTVEIAKWQKTRGET